MTGAAWMADWAWGVPLICSTLAFHAAGIALAAQCLDAVGVFWARRRTGAARNGLFGTALLGAVGGTLAAMHALEALIWALAYQWLGAIESFAGAMLYSLDSLTTRGESKLDLEPHWRLLGAMEAMNRVLLFGISTAFLFAVIERAWRLLRPQANNSVAGFMS